MKTEHYCIICTTRLPRKLVLWKRNPSVRLRLQHQKCLASAPAIQNCLGSGLPLHSPACFASSFSEVLGKTAGLTTSRNFVSQLFNWHELVAAEARLSIDTTAFTSFVHCFRPMVAALRDCGFQRVSHHMKTQNVTSVRQLFAARGERLDNDFIVLMNRLPFDARFIAQWERCGAVVINTKQLSSRGEFSFHSFVWLWAARQLLATLVVMFTPQQLSSVYHNSSCDGCTRDAEKNRLWKESIMNITAKANDTNDIQYCKRFDNSCYHHQCIAIELQWSCCRFLLVIQEKSAVKKWKTQRTVSVVT